MNKFIIRRSIAALSCFGFVLKQFIRAPFCYERDRELRDFFAALRDRQNLSYTRLPALDVMPLFERNEGIEFRWYETADEFRDRFRASRFVQLHDRELVFLALITAICRPKTIFEFGTGNGWSTFNMFLNAPEDAEIFSIDKMRRVSADARINEWLKSSQLHRILGLSQEFDCAALAHKVDLIFIDGDHGYKGVKADTDKALQMIAPGGTILWHDYSLKWPGVYRHLNELGQTMPIKHLRGTSLAVLRC